MRLSFCNYCKLKEIDRPPSPQPPTPRSAAHSANEVRKLRAGAPRIYAHAAKHHSCGTTQAAHLARCGLMADAKASTEVYFTTLYPWPYFTKRPSTCSSGKANKRGDTIRNPADYSAESRQTDRQTEMAASPCILHGSITPSGQVRCDAAATPPPPARTSFHR